MTPPKGRLWQPDSPEQEVLANGAVCGNALRALAKMWARDAGDRGQWHGHGQWHGEPSGTPDPHFFRGDGLPQVVNPPPSLVIYPLDRFDDDEKPVMSPITEATMHSGAEDLPILAWAVAPGGGVAAVVVDMMERPRRPGREGEAGDPVTYADCKVITGTPSAVLPRELRELLRLI